MISFLSRITGREDKSLSWLSLFCYALLVGCAAGILWSMEPPQVSRWDEYQAIQLGASQQETVSLIESGLKSQSGCGALHYESRDQVCRFEDPWRSYVIKFNPVSKQVALKRFNFKWYGSRSIFH